MDGMFRFAGRIAVASFVITGYLFVFLFQIIWYLIHRRPDEIGDAFGQFARGAIDAVAAIFRD